MKVLYVYSLIHICLLCHYLMTSRVHRLIINSSSFLLLQPVVIRNIYGVALNNNIIITAHIQMTSLNKKLNKYCFYCMHCNSLTHSFPVIYNTTWTWRYFLCDDEWCWHGMSSTNLLYCILTIVLYCACHPSVHYHTLIQDRYIIKLLHSSLLFILPPSSFSSFILLFVAATILLYIRVVSRNCILFILGLLVT